jgi:hypothetical protein
MLDVSKPTPLRLAGFIATVLGAVLIAVGSLQTWVTISIASGGLSTPSPGTDLVDGKVTLAAGLVLLFGILVLRLAAGGARRLVAVVLVVAALVVLAIGVNDAVRLKSRFESIAVDKIAAAIAPELGLPIDAVKTRVRAQAGKLIRTEDGVGLWLVIAGGVIGVAGGLLDLAWVGRETLRGDEG